MKTPLEQDPAYLKWLIELTAEGYDKGIMISSDHADAVMTIYILKGDDDLDKCLKMYQNFCRRWKALHEIGI